MIKKDNYNPTKYSVPIRSVLGGIDVLTLMIRTIVFLRGVAIVWQILASFRISAVTTHRPVQLGVVFALIPIKSSVLVLSIIVAGFAIVLKDFIEFSLVICSDAAFPFVMIQIAVFVIPIADKALYVGGVINLA